MTSPDQDIPDVTSATLTAGRLTITVCNNLPVPISAEEGADQLVLTLEDPGSGIQVALLTFGPVPPGAALTRTLDLAGKSLPDAVAVTLTGGSPGSAGAPVTINGTDSIGIEVVLADLVVSSAEAVVDAQSFFADCTIDLSDDYGILAADIASGDLCLQLVNELAVPCRAEVSWPQIRDLAGQPLSMVVDLDPDQSDGTAVDLAGMRVVAEGSPLTQLTGRLEVTTPGSVGQSVNLSASDVLTAELDGGQVVFASLTGTVPLSTWDLDPLSEELDLPDELDGLQLVAATLVLNLSNTADLPAELDLTVTGCAADGQLSTLRVTELIAPARDRSPAVTTIVLDQSNSTIVELLNTFPETITLAGSVTSGGDGVIGTVRQGDFAVLDWHLTAPLEIVVTGSAITGDPARLDVDEDIQEMIAKRALGARVDLEVLNHLPVAFDLRILAAVDTATIFSEPEVAIGPVRVNAATVDQETGIVQEALVSRPVLVLDRQQARVFGESGLHTVVEAVLPASEGNPVRMMATDFLEVRGIITLEVLIDDDW